MNVLKVNKDVKKISNYIVSILKEKGLYDDSLDIQIFSSACQVYQLNKLMNAYIESTAIIENSVRGGGSSYKKNPLINDLTNVSESLRKNLKALGITYDAKVMGVTDNDPLKNMIDNINSIGDDKE